MTRSAATDRRILKSKIALKESLLSLMQSHDFKEITITDIVLRADLNRGTFYKHYQYKEELLDEIVDDVITDLIASYREPYQHTETFALKDLTSSAIKIFEHVDKHATFYTLVVKSRALSGFQIRIGNELKRLTLQDLEDWQPNPEINYELFASYQAYAILGMIMEWIHDDFKYTANYMAKQLLAFLHISPMNAVYRTKNHYRSK